MDLSRRLLAGEINADVGGGLVVQHGLVFDKRADFSDGRPSRTSGVQDDHFIGQESMMDLPEHLLGAG